MSFKIDETRNNFDVSSKEAGGNPIPMKNTKTLPQRFSP